MPVSLVGDEAYLGVKNFPMRVEKDQIPYVKVFKNGPVIEPYLSRRYADARDLFGKLAGLEMQMVDKGSVIRRWQRIIIDYGQYTFANIDHAAVMRDEARRINEKIGLQLFIEGKNGNASIDYTLDRSSVAYTLYDSSGNPAQAVVYKKKYCGAENWSRAEAQRLLLSLAMGINLDDQFFPDEHIAVERQDARLPDEVWDALKAMYNLPIGTDIKVFDRGGEKPAIYVDGKAEINSPIKLVVVVPDGASIPTLEYMIAEKNTREFWSAESADEQPKYQGTDGGRWHIFTFQTEWPGPRRFRATTNGGAAEGLLDVLVKAEKEPGYLKGFTLVGLLDYMKDDPFLHIYSTLSRLKENGINLVTLVPEWYVENYTSTEIHPEPGFLNGYARTWPDELTKMTIAAIQEFGMKVVLKPHVMIKDNLDGVTWFAYLQPQNHDWDALFKSLEQYLIHYAKIAESFGVEYMCIGTELNSMTIPNWRGVGVSDPERRWRELLANLRNVYYGKITLSLPSLQIGHEDGVNGVAFWDALDFIGFEPYGGLTGRDDPVNNGKDDPTLQELIDGFDYWIQKTLMPTYEKYQKKIFITECNYYSFDGVNRTPVNWNGSKIIDWKEQADCYNVMLKYIKNSHAFEAVTCWPGWIFNDALVHPWWGSWDERMKSGDNVLDWLWGKPAEKIIQANWKV